MIVLDTRETIHAAQYAYAFYCELAQQDDEHIASIYTCCACNVAYEDDGGDLDVVDRLCMQLSTRFTEMIWPDAGYFRSRNPLGQLIRDENLLDAAYRSRGKAKPDHPHYHRLVELRRFYIAWVITHLEMVLGYE